MHNLQIGLLEEDRKRLRSESLSITKDGYYLPASQVRRLKARRNKQEAACMLGRHDCAQEGQEFHFTAQKGETTGWLSTASIGGAIKAPTPPSSS
jgi:hypothetical protein